MPVAHFTTRWAEALKPLPGQKQTDYFDKRSLGRGRRFGLRVSYRGTKTWCVWFRFEGRTRRVNIGHYPGLGLADARQEADRQLEAILSGRDPAAERQADKHAETVAELVVVYIDRYAKRHKKSWRRDQAIFDRDVLPLWGQRKVKDIRRRDVVALTDGIVDRGAPIQANRVFEVVRKMFNWAVERDLLEHSPCSHAKRPSPENPCDRVLTKPEIGTFWTRLENTDATEPVQLALKLILVTGQRKGEIANAAKSEFDLGEAVWTIPPEHSKNGQAHFVPLSPLAVDLFRRAFELSGDSLFVFPSPRGHRTPVLSSAVDMAVRRNRKVIGVDHWTPHDLRRTASTRMTEIGIPGEIVDRILNHKVPGVRAVYDRYSYAKEKRQALEKWARQLEAIVNGEVSRVIPLR